MNRSIINEDIENIVSDSNIDFRTLDSSRILITGAAGFLPAYMVETLAHLNQSKGSQIEIVAAVRNKKRAEERFSPLGSDSGITYIEQDVSRPIDVKGPVDYVIHAASQASPKFFGPDPVGTLRPNTLGTAHLLDLAYHKKSKGFLFFSSAEVYGRPNGDNSLTKEDEYGYIDPSQVRSCYGESKRMGETMCVCWAHQYGVIPKIVRPFHTYGPGLKLDDGRVYSDFVANYLQGSNLKINSDGKAQRAYCYLSDATRGFFTVLLKGVASTPYNVGNPGAVYSVKEVADTIAGLSEDGSVQVEMNPPKENIKGYLKSGINHVAPDISQIRELGWEPQIGIREGFQRTIESYR